MLSMYIRLITLNFLFSAFNTYKIIKTSLFANVCRLLNRTAHHTKTTWQEINHANVSNQSAWVIWVRVFYSRVD